MIFLMKKVIDTDPVDSQKYGLIKVEFLNGARPCFLEGTYEN
jgi:hypothetical protein